MVYELIFPNSTSIIFWGFVFFFIGASIGSYIDVVRVRGSWKASLKGRSKCTFCNCVLSWYELLPLVSYFALKGKCSSCSLSIPRHHLYSEVLMGSLFIVSLFSSSIYSMGVVILSAIFLVPIVLTDIEKMEVPEHFSIPFVYISLAIASIISIQTLSIEPVLNGLLLALPFYLIWLVSSGRAMGLGDSKVAISLGFLLPAIQDSFSVFVFTFWLGTLGIAIFFPYRKIKTGSIRLVSKMHIPLVPSMALAYFIVLVTGFSFVDIIYILQ